MESVYKVIELVGTSTESWEKAATAAVERAAESLRDLRIAEVVELDMQIEDGKAQVCLKKTDPYKAKKECQYQGHAQEPHKGINCGPLLLLPDA